MAVLLGSQSERECESRDPHNPVVHNLNNNNKKQK